MKKIANTAGIITNLLVYVFFLATSCAVVELNTSEAEAPAVCVAASPVSNNADNINTTGLVSFGGMQLL
ncbi:MAG TPA: hypothetical protein PKM63_21645 [Panacibacter sp.]|nr:hypothetical protein [Panacibacter sp.]HNP46916.1 hypothetical protein [Panacibacter sp.]